MPQVGKVKVESQLIQLFPPSPLHVLIPVLSPIVITKSKSPSQFRSAAAILDGEPEVIGEEISNQLPAGSLTPPSTQTATPLVGLAGGSQIQDAIVVDISQGYIPPGINGVRLGENLPGAGQVTPGFDS